MKPFFTFLFIYLLNSILLFGQVEVINNPEKGLWQDREESPITFELVQTYGAEFPDLGAAFSTSDNINSIKTDHKGNVYVLDSRLPLLVKFSDSGKHIWEWSQEGRGPGDLQIPLGLGVTDSLIFISNLFGSRLDVLDNSGNFIESINTSEFSKSPLNLIGVIDERFLVMKNNVSGKAGIQVTVLDIDNELDVFSQFEATDETELEIPAGAQINKSASIIDEQIVVAGAMSYEMCYYDKEGNLKKKVKREFQDFFRPGVYNGGQRGYALQLGGLVPFYETADEYLLNYVIWPTNIDDPDQAAEDATKGKFPKLDQKNSIDLFTNQGKLLFSIKKDGFVPEIGRLKHSDNEGFIYTTSNTPYPQVRKYKVKIED